MRCPNCGHSQPDGAEECGNCQIVISKWLERSLRSPRLPGASGQGSGPEAAGLWPRVRALVEERLFYSPGVSRRWNPYKLAGAALAAGYFLPTIIGPYRTIVVNWVDILCHEGGHVIFQATGSDFWIAFGGSFTQLFFPLAFAVHFWRARQRFSAAVVLFWAANVLSHISWYAGTSREMGPMAYGPFGHPGLHDFHEMFVTLGVLQYDRLISGFLKAGAIAGGAVALGYAIYASCEPVLAGGEEGASRL